MSDLISRKEAMDAIMSTEPFIVEINGEQYVGQKTSDVMDVLQVLPSADPERKKGKWIEDETGYGYWTCSACGFVTEASAANILYHFCPNCGADLRLQNT